MKRSKKKQKSGIVRGPCSGFTVDARYRPKIGETVIITKSSVCWADGKKGKVEKPHDGGWAVELETGQMVWAEEVCPFAQSVQEKNRCVDEVR